MRFLTIAMKDLKVRLSDRKGFIMLLVMPIILTAILGSALSGAFGETSILPDTTVGVVIVEKDDLTNQFLQEVLQGEDLKSSFSIIEYETEEHLKTAVEMQSVDVGMLLPVGWGNSLINGESKVVKILTDPEKQLQSTIIESITSSFIDRVTSVSIATRVFATEMTTPVSNPSVNIGEITSALANQLSTLVGTNLNAVTTEDNGTPAISGMQYYAAAMGAMFVLFNATIGAKSIIQERSTETLARLMSSPIRQYAIVGGKFLGTFYFSFLQFLVFTIATHYLFGVSWGNNPLQIGVIGLVYAVAVSGLAMIIAGFVTQEKTADTVGGIGVQIFALLGGSMIPSTAFPDSLKQLAIITPNKWVLDSLLEIMSGTTWSTLLLPIVILLSIGFISLFLGSLRLKLR